jgi:competence protein ComEC
LAFLAALFGHAWSGEVWLPWLAGVPVWAAVPVLAMGAAAVQRAAPARFVLICAVAFLAGVWRYDAALAAQPPRMAMPTAKMSSFAGRVAVEPRVGIKNTVLTLDRVLLMPNGAAPAPLAQGIPVGRHVMVTLRVPPSQLEIGDTVVWQCRPYLPPSDTDDGPVASPWRCSSTREPRVIAPREGHAVSNALLRAKNRVRATVRKLVPEPDASFVLGLLLGDTGGLPQETVAEFRGVGASHVLAVSGFNVAIVAQFAFVFFALLRVPRRAAAVFVAVPLAGFAALAGGGAPVVRAAVMGGVGVVAALLGRRNAGWGPLLFAACGMLALDPLDAATDIGFHLSFAAVASMRAFGKMIERVLGWVPEAFGLRGAIGETISATLGTLPISLHAFGSFPVAALPANVLIVPVVAFSTGMGGLLLLCGLVGSTLGAPWLGLPAAFVATLCTSFMRLVAATGNTAAPPIPAQASTAQALLITACLVLLWQAGTRLPERSKAL